MDGQMTPAEIVEKVATEAKGMSRPVYRGQAKASWNLLSGAVHRLQEAHGHHILEDDNKLKKLVSDYHEDLILRMKVIGGDQTSDLQQLSTLQHHGAATGLLDFTESPLAALWFACKDEPDEDGKIFVLDIGDRQVAVNGRKQNWDNLFNSERIVYYEPDRSLSPRIVAQQSLFVICNPPRVLDLHLRFVVVPSVIKGAVLEYLKWVGVSEESLFRDVPGLAAANTRHKPIRLTLTPEDHKDWGNRAYQAERYERALEHYTAYARALPHEIQPNCLIADTLSALQRYQEAIDAYTRAIEMIAESPDLKPELDVQQAVVGPFMLGRLYYNRGNAHAAVGKHVQAVSDYDGALEHGDQRRRSVLFNRGNSKYALERYEEAFADFEAVWSEREGSDIAHSMGNCKVLSGKFSEGLKWYREGVRSGEPESSAVHCRKHVEHLQQLLDMLDSNYDVRRERHFVYVYVEAIGESASFLFVGNKGNIGNTGMGMGMPGGEGYEGGSGFVVVVEPKQNEPSN